MVLEQKLGTNPYKFGMIGATDSHTSLATAEEENFFGKSVTVEPSAERINHPFISSDLATIERYQLAAAGYQGTTGPRMVVRFFGGWDYTEHDLRSRAPAFRGYEKGVPMGGDLTMAPEGKSPTFMAYVLRDPMGANLDRPQIVKGWVDKKGETNEKVYDVAWSGDRRPGPDSKLPAVGNTVDVEAANWTNTIRASGPTPIWIPSSARSIMCVCSRFRRRSGTSMTRCGSAPSCRKAFRRVTRNAHTHHPSGIRRS